DHKADVTKAPNALYAACQEGHAKVAEILLKHGADMNAKTSDGWTHLERAAWEGFDGIVQMLIDHKADVTNDPNALSRPCRKGHANIVQMLLDAGSDPGAKDWKGRTPLIPAAEKGHANIVQMLLDAGSDPGAKDWEGRTPLIAAAENGHSHIVALLLENCH